MLIPHLNGVLRRRDTDQSSNNTQRVVYFIIGGGAALLFILIGILVVYKRLRQRRQRATHPPKSLPTFLHPYWRRWVPNNQYEGLTRSGPTQLETALESRDTRHSVSASASASTPATIHEGELDRQQSVRSILTLPPYRVAPLPTEQLIAREGERAGVDVVVDLPESETEVEARREEEMAALFRIRETRRREESEREERREQRRAARDAGDVGLIERLEAERRQRAAQRATDQRTLENALAHAERTGDADLAAPSSRHLVAELGALRESHAHSRRVSAVSYADLGLARHDGSRLRADSIDSRDDRPLLDGAAGMGGNRSRAVSVAGSDDGLGGGGVGGGGSHSRTPSATRDLTHDQGVGHHRNRSEGQLSYRSTGSGTQQAASPSGGRRPSGPHLLSPDLASPQQHAAAPHLPPSYEDDLSVHGGTAPPYQGTVEPRQAHAPEWPHDQQQPQYQTRPQLAITPAEEDNDNNELSNAALAAESYLSHGSASRSRSGSGRSADDEAEWEVVSGSGPPVQMPAPPSMRPMQGAGQTPTSKNTTGAAALQRLRTHDSDTPPAVQVTGATPTSATSPQLRR